ncbi:hypothetical protein AGLY_002772 [Aphis glycines]|uniref:Uncharacterized protein n=1 Tax=Aphis glycines TaxID=307491 RepID=A0A6G0U171_APHGL|nr:hypothetical protein AGLY_002772 [Aphis glycines]
MNCYENWDGYWLIEYYTLVHNVRVPLNNTINRLLQLFCLKEKKMTVYAYNLNKKLEQNLYKKEKNFNTFSTDMRNKNVVPMIMSVRPLNKAPTYVNTQRIPKNLAESTKSSASNKRRSSTNTALMCTTANLLSSSAFSCGSLMSKAVLYRQNTPNNYTTERTRLNKLALSNDLCRRPQRRRHAPQWRLQRQDDEFHVAAAPPPVEKTMSAVTAAVHRHRRPTYVVVVVCTTITVAAADYIVPHVRVESATTADVYVVHAASDNSTIKLSLWARDLFRSTRDRCLTLYCKHYDDDDDVVDRSRTRRVTK